MIQYLYSTRIAGLIAFILVVISVRFAAAQSADAAAEPADMSTETPAAASTELQTPGADAATPRKHIRDHRHQGFVNILFGAGWYIAAPYDKNDPEKACGFDDDGDSKPVCSAASAMHLDFIGGFGITRGIELLLMYRQGVQQPELGRPQLRLLGAGVKFYTPAQSLFKMGVGVVPMIDFSEKTGVSSNDFVLHIPILAQWDFVRWFGLYLQAAPNFSFVSEFRLDLTYGIGVQGRFP
jgi:hypothetical protein